MLTYLIDSANRAETVGSNRGGCRPTKRSLTKDVTSGSSKLQLAFSNEYAVEASPDQDALNREFPRLGDSMLSDEPVNDDLS